MSSEVLEASIIGSEEVVVYGIASGGTARGHANLAKDRREMGVNGTRVDDQLFRHLLVGHALSHQAQHLDLVREAIHACKASGQPITKVKLSNMVGVDSATLHNYLQVRALMTKAANEDQQQRREMFYQEREEELIRQVVNAIQQLQDAGKRISVQAVGEIVHLSPAGLHYYPKVGIILESAITGQRTPR